MVMVMINGFIMQVKTRRLISRIFYLVLRQLGRDTPIGQDNVKYNFRSLRYIHLLIRNAMSSVPFLQVVHRGCGIDVHKDIVVATINGESLKSETCSYKTFSSSLTELKEWLNC